MVEAWAQIKNNNHWKSPAFNAPQGGAMPENQKPLGLLLLLKHFKLYL